jgi:hypothetical protein
VIKQRANKDPKKESPFAEGRKKEEDKEALLRLQMKHNVEENKPNFVPVQFATNVKVSKEGSEVAPQPATDAPPAKSPQRAA